MEIVPRWHQALSGRDREMGVDVSVAKGPVCVVRQELDEEMRSSVVNVSLDTSPASVSSDHSRILTPG